MANIDQPSTILLKPNNKVKNCPPKHPSCGPLLFGVFYLYALSLPIVILMCHLFSSCQYFYKTFFTALNQVNCKTLRAFLIKFFLNYSQNPTPNFKPNPPFLKEGRIIVEIIFNYTRLFLYLN